MTHPEQTNNQPLSHTHARILILAEVQRLGNMLQAANRGIEEQWVYDTQQQMKQLADSYHTLGSTNAST